MELEEVKRKIVGPAVPLITPLKPDYELDLDGLRTIARFAVDNGIVEGKATLMAVTAAGECPALTMEERKRAMEVVADEVGGKVPLITSAQDCSLKNVIELCKHAEKLGYDCIQISPPFYFDTSPAEVIRFFELINEATNIGVMVYNTTWLGVLGGKGIDTELMERLYQIGNIISVKWSSPNFYTYIDVLRNYADKMAFIDNQYHGLGHLFGAKGFLAVIGGFYPKYVLRLWELYEARRYNEAIEELWKLQIPLYQWFKDMAEQGINGEGAILKPCFSMVGLPAGPARPPNDMELNEEQRSRLREILIKGGVPVV